MTERTCTMLGCTRVHHSRGFCRRHEESERRAGRLPNLPPPALSPITIFGDVARVHLNHGFVAVIDAADVDLISGKRWRAWFAKRVGSYYALTGRSNDAMHTVLMRPDPGMTVDHANHDTLDNRRANLRIATYGQNSQNRRRGRGNTTGYLGLARGRRPDRWEVRVQQRYVGVYPSIEEAARSRDQYIRDHLDPTFWTFNFPMHPGERSAIPR